MEIGSDGLIRPDGREQISDLMYERVLPAYNVSRRPPLVDIGMVRLGCQNRAESLLAPGLTAFPACVSCGE